MHSFFRAAMFGLAISLGAAVTTASTPVAADPPGGFQSKGKGKGGGDSAARASGRGGKGSSMSIDISIGGHDEVIIRDYFGDMARAGKCPPGLAKKNNGCLPPGQAKKWAIGRPLPRDVIFYDIPGDLRIRLSVPPEGYKYVRVASDILMIAIGTGMVAAAIEDIARL